MLNNVLQRKTDKANCKIKHTEEEIATRSRETGFDVSSDQRNKTDKEQKNNKHLQNRNRK